MAIEQAESLPSSINVLTFNCWGLKYLAKQRNARLNEIGARIASSEPSLDIVGLQECWTQEDYRSIRQQTQHILPYGKFYHSGIFGGGLAILSRWRIEESNMVRYPLNGRPTAFFRGDWFVGKGVACARIRMGPSKSDVVEVFTTHVSNAARFLQLVLLMAVLTHSSFTHLTSANPTIPTSATVQPKHGKLPNSCEAPSNAVISSLD